MIRVGTIDAVENADVSADALNAPPVVANKIEPIMAEAIVRIELSILPV